MKKILFCICALLCCWHSVSAQFVLTTEGIRNAEDLSKDYIILPCDGKTQDELYKKTKLFITSNYVSAQDVLSESYPEMLSISAHADFIFKYQGMSGRLPTDLHYKVNVYFKDNRIKLAFYIVSITYKHMMNVNLVSSSAGVGIFAKNGNVRDEEAKKQLENIANSFVDRLVVALNDKQTSNSDDNW